MTNIKSMLLHQEMTKEFSMLPHKLEIPSQKHSQSNSDTTTFHINLTHKSCNMTNILSFSEGVQLVTRNIKYVKL